MDTKQALLEKRDRKAVPHLEQYAPVWIVDEKVMLTEEAVQFNVVFQHNLYGWVNRRYRYDGFNDVLYHKGQTALSEEEVVEHIQNKEAFINPILANIPNAYGG